MSWKNVLGFIFFIVVLVLLSLYWFLPLNPVQYTSFRKPGNTNFSLDNSTKMQFYDNLRYQNKKISYKIEGCNIKKQDEMKRAFEIIENLTILRFYPVFSEEEIYVTCERTRRFEGSFFVAGEGGPINITKTDNFNVIFKGAITLIRDSQCEEPNVALHELLHALGFDHSLNPKNIMYNITNCDQEIGEDIPRMINWLYSFPTLPDLSLEEASASMSGRYVNVEFIIKNQGLKKSEETNVKIYADNKEIQKIDLEEIEVGGGKIIKITNILVLQKSVDEIKIFVDYANMELNKENNEIILKIKNKT